VGEEEPTRKNEKMVARKVKEKKRGRKMLCETNWKDISIKSNVT
jgi:hypothetical protein